MDGFAGFGLIGLGVMGENLALNLGRSGLKVAVYNRNPAKVDAFASGRGSGGGFVFCRTPEEFCLALERPRRIIMMVKAGEAVDEVISSLTGLLEPGDVLIDGGNSFFTDTGRRVAALGERGIHFIGCGISGGEEGALNGPSLMPGGDAMAWPLVEPVMMRIAAKASDGRPCCSWIGPDGSGHYVKMVHNGIEYSDMQLIAEAYWLLEKLAGFSADELAVTFAAWNRTELESYLIEITAAVCGATDAKTGRPMLEVILDRAGQKGTGSWTAVSSLELGVAAPSFAEAVFARSLSANKDQRVRAAARFPKAAPRFDGDRTVFAEKVRKALYASKICAYAQGFALLRRASGEYSWLLSPGDIALLWRGGCIIRAAFLDRIAEAFSRDAGLDNLLFDDYFASAVRECESSWRDVVAAAAGSGIPVPAMSGALAWFDGFSSSSLPANLIQAQRDYFGAHTFERVDAPRGEFFHRDWSGK